MREKFSLRNGVRVDLSRLNINNSRSSANAWDLEGILVAGFSGAWCALQPDEWWRVTFSPPTQGERNKGIAYAKLRGDITVSTEKLEVPPQYLAFGRSVAEKMVAEVEIRLSPEGVQATVLGHKPEKLKQRDADHVGNHLANVLEQMSG